MRGKSENRVISVRQNREIKESERAFYLIIF